MSRPDEVDKQNDLVGDQIDDIVKFLEEPYNEAAYEKKDPDWKPARLTVSRLRRKIQDYIENDALQYMPQSEMMELVKALDTLLFNHMFLFAIPGRNVDLAWTTSHLRGDGATVAGVMVVEKERKVSIGIQASLNKSFEKVLGTLLHEMVHAFIVVRGPEHSPVLSNTNSEFYRVFQKLNGKGHGYYWQRLAHAVENWSQAVLDVPSLRLDRLIAMDIECKVTGSVPGMAYFEEFYGDRTIKGQHGPTYALRYVTNQATEKEDELKKIRKRREYGYNSSIGRTEENNDDVEG